MYDNNKMEYCLCQFVYLYSLDENLFTDTDLIIYFCCKFKITLTTFLRKCLPLGIDRFFGFMG